jgi:hypothetical protein
MFHGLDGRETRGIFHGSVRVFTKTDTCHPGKNPVFTAKSRKKLTNVDELEKLTTQVATHDGAALAHGLGAKWSGRENPAFVINGSRFAQHQEAPVRKGCQPCADPACRATALHAFTVDDHGWHAGDGRTLLREYPAVKPGAGDHRLRDPAFPAPALETGPA